MKKVIYLLTILFAVVLMNISCEKEDDPIVPEGAITLDELEGVWVSSQYDYNNNSYFNCADLETSIDTDVMSGDLMLITFIVGSTSNLSDNCSGLETNGMNLNYDRSAGKIVLEIADIYLYKFNVINYNRNTETLILQLTDENIGGPAIPIGGKYTLQNK